MCWKRCRRIYVLKAMLACFGMFRFGRTWEEALCMFDKNVLEAMQLKKYVLKLKTPKNWQKQPRTQMKAMPVLQPRARRPRRMRIVPGRKSTKHASIAFRLPASLPAHFYQTCTRPLPMLGQSETCQNEPASLLECKRAISMFLI